MPVTRMLRETYLGYVSAARAVSLLYIWLTVLPLVSGARSDENLEACIEPGMVLVCSGRGECVYGVCECYARRSNSAQRYSGKYCECDDYSCPFHNNILCGGHGECQCGECKCDPGYTSEACGCPMSNATCMTSTGKVCNDVGKCQCGVCVCNPDSSYKGPTCEECPTCPGKCQENRNCALCVAFQTGPYTPEQCSSQCGHVKVVEEIDMEMMAADHHICQYIDDEDDCRYYFTYYYGKTNEVQVEVQETKECKPPVTVKSKDDDPKGGSTGLKPGIPVIVLTAVIFLLGLLM